MYAKQQSAGDVNFKILKCLEDRKWKVLYVIQQSSVFDTPVNLTRLKGDLVDLKKLELVLDKDDWADLSTQEKNEEYKKNLGLEPAVKEKHARYLYQITDKGKEKFDKIKNDCLDDTTQQILHIHKKDEDMENDFIDLSGTKDSNE